MSVPQALKGFALVRMGSDVGVARVECPGCFTEIYRGEMTRRINTVFGSAVSPHSLYNRARDTSLQPGINVLLLPPIISTLI